MASFPEYSEDVNDLQNGAEAEQARPFLERTLTPAFVFELFAWLDEEAPTNSEKVHSNLRAKRELFRQYGLELSLKLAMLAEIQGNQK